MKDERIEEYLETILYLIRKNDLPAKTKQIAQELDVSQPSVTEMLGKLSSLNLVQYTPYHGVTFTDSGFEKAQKIKRRHQLIEKFLVELLGIEAGVAHKEACTMEHAVSDDVLENMCAVLGHPDTCPDGNPILTGECCKKEEDGKFTMLSDMQGGENAKILAIACTQNIRQRLSSLGLMVGDRITVKRKLGKGTLSIFTKGTEIAIGSDIASKIIVKKVVS